MTFQGRHHTAETKARIGAANAVIRQSLTERFWAKVDKSGECWEWLGMVLSKDDRRGRLWLDGKRQYAARVAWVLENGPIPDGLNVCHHCDNPPCVRPDHLFLGTQVDNLNDASEKGRLSKLTADSAEEIRNRYATEEISFQRLAGEYGVSNYLISCVIHRQKAWKYV